MNLQLGETMLERIVAIHVQFVVQFCFNL